MKIEAGKFYRTRGGQKVGPMRHDFGIIWDSRECYPNDGDYHWTEDGKSGRAANADCPDLIAEWSEPMDLTAPDYNDGLWHGWNGGECPVDPRSEVEWIWHDPAQNTAGKSEGPARRAAWRSHVLKFRVTKPAPPKPREWWINAGSRTVVLHETYESANEGRRNSRGEIAHGYEADPIHVREVLPTKGATE